MDLPRRIGRYEIVARLAMGGMAEILLGRLTGPQGFERPVVIKRMLPHLARVARAGEMFIDEARVTARIQHPNVVQVLELGQDGDEYFMAMEYVEGESAATLVRRLLADGRRLDFVLAAHIVAEACAGLHAAHELCDASGAPLDVVHRDVSPENLLVTYVGACKVADFGIAKGAHRLGASTGSGEIKGKLVYMSPEQIESKPLDRRTDVFSLGAVLYELTTNRRLFKRPTPAQVVRAVCTEPIVRPSRLVAGYPPALEDVCMKALARSRDERYATAAELRASLLSVMRTLGDVADPAAELARLMRELFAERIVEKTVMLREVREGSVVSAIPSAEIDVEIDVPSEIDPPQGPRGGGRRAVVLALAAAALVSLLAMVFAFARPRLSREPIVAAGGAAAVAASSGSAAPAVEPSSTAQSPESTSAAPSAPPAEVTLHVETTPPGAAVRVGGRDMGRTPCDVRLPKDEREVRVELRLRGFATLTQPVKPDVDQRLLVSLVRASTPAPRRPAPARSASGGIPVFPD